MCTTHNDIIKNMHVQFIKAINLIHVVFGKTQTCIIFCFIFTKGLMEHCSMVRGGVCINYEVVWALHHSDSQAPPTVPHKGSAESLNGVSAHSCAHVNASMRDSSVALSPLWHPPNHIIQSISQLMCSSSRYHLTEGLNLTLVLCCIHLVHEALRM